MAENVTPVTLEVKDFAAREIVKDRFQVSPVVVEYAFA